MSRDFFIFFLIVIAIRGGALEEGGCPVGETVSFEKYVGWTAGSDAGSSVFVYTSSRGEAALAATCVTRCRDTSNCAGVLVRAAAGDCVGIGTSRTLSLKPDNDISFFAKICTVVPSSCKDKLWSIETSPGYQLHPSHTGEIIRNSTQFSCTHMLSTSHSDGFKSAQFVPDDPMLAPDLYALDAGPARAGTCLLSTEDKYTEPESYHVANYDTFYKESQCLDDFPRHIDRCSYEEYYNQTLRHVELMIQGLTKSECKSACESESRFVCRGFTVGAAGAAGAADAADAAGAESRVECALHSEDILTLGSWLLKKKKNYVFYRRVTCLNLTVQCDEEQMHIRYTPRSEFRGRLYTAGAASSPACGADGRGREPVSLALSLKGTCPLATALALHPTLNRTLVYTMVVVQNNPIIQMQGDRFVRVGCVLGEAGARAEVGPGTNVTVDTALNVNSGIISTQNRDQLETPPIPASTVINLGSASAEAEAGVGAGSGARGVRMSVLEQDAPAPGSRPHHLDAGTVTLGQDLELRIEASLDSDLDMAAYHLVAASRLGDNSVLLLDNRGCPTGQVEFPALERVVTNASASSFVSLRAPFKAFRFPDSHVVRFTVMVKFCKHICDKVSCSNTRDSRDVSEQEIISTHYAGASSLIASSGSGHTSVAGAHDCGELASRGQAAGDRAVSLDLAFAVASRDVLTADRLMFGEPDKVIIAGVDDGGFSHNLICMHEMIFIGVAFVWLFIQILILVGCLLVIRKYRRFAESQSQKDYHSFDNVGCDSLRRERPRVHWPDQSVDILHAH